MESNENEILVIFKNKYLLELQLVPYDPFKCDPHIRKFRLNKYFEKTVVLPGKIL